MINSEQRLLELDKGSPFAGFQFVETTFPATPNTDHLIPHSLKASDPEGVDYLVVGADAAASVYHDGSSTRQPWDRGFIILRCSVASVTVRLLLALPRT